MKNIKFSVSDKRGNNTIIKISEIGKLKAFDNPNKVYSFLVECNTQKESEHFIFYNSLDFTQNIKIKKSKNLSGLNEKEIRSLIYDVLACIEIDYNSEDTNLSEFISNYGYEYNQDTENLFYKVKEQKAKLHKVFSEEQIKYFDENEDILKKFVDGLTYEKIDKDTI